LPLSSDSTSGVVTRAIQAGMSNDPAITHSIRATVMQTPSPSTLEVLTDQWIGVGHDGRIAEMRAATASDRADVRLPPTSILIPGLIDTHIHAPQWPQRGAGLDLPLERWLQDYTFPLEARFADTAFAEDVWESLVPSLLAEGTTTATYYSSIHPEATASLADACRSHGQRAFVGRVAMDHPANTPDDYRDRSAAAGIDASRASLETILAIDGGRELVTPIITPRFIPACTDELLHGLGSLAEETGVRVQTHCSESIWEQGYVLDRCGVTDTEALDDFGLLRDHSVLAHSVHISSRDRKRMIERGAGVAHCPLSNSYFGDGVFPVREHLHAGLRIGLGTDVAGGPEHSMRASCGHAVTSSRMLEAGVEPGRDRSLRPGQRIDLMTAFWMATMGGAELLGIDAGLLAVGRLFDAVAIDPTTDVSSRFDDVLGVSDDRRRFDRLARGAGTITSVWVDGSLVVSAD
jgi:guanine deaminase